MLPKWLPSKLSPNEAFFGDAKVKVDMINCYDKHSDFDLEILSQFKKHLTKQHVVGLSVEADQNGCTRVLVLCAGDHCLMVDLSTEYTNCLNKSSHELPSKRPVLQILNDLLRTDDFCFVFVKSSVDLLRTVRLECKSYMEVGHLAARVRKNPSLLSYRSLKNLGAELGLDIKERKKVNSLDWDAQVFSDEDIGFAIHNAYYCYFIGDKLLSGSLKKV